MVGKKGDGVPTIGTKNLGRQKFQEVEIAEDIAPTGRGTTTLKDQPARAAKNTDPPKPGGGG